MCSCQIQNSGMVHNQPPQNAPEIKALPLPVMNFGPEPVKNTSTTPDNPNVVQALPLPTMNFDDHRARGPGRHRPRLRA